MSHVCRVHALLRQGLAVLQHSLQQHLCRPCLQCATQIMHDRVQAVVTCTPHSCPAMQTFRTHVMSNDSSDDTRVCVHRLPAPSSLSHNTYTHLVWVAEGHELSQRTCLYCTTGLVGRQCMRQITMGGIQRLHAWRGAWRDACMHGGRHVQELHGIPIAVHVTSLMGYLWHACIQILHSAQAGMC